MIVFIYYWIPCYFIYCWIAFCQGILHQCPYDLMFGLPLFKILCWNPNLHWGTIGRWDFGGVGRVRLGHVSRDFVMALVALKVGENPSLYFALFPHARTEKRPCKDVEKKKNPYLQARKSTLSLDTKLADTLILDFSVFRTMRNASVV